MSNYAEVIGDPIAHSLSPAIHHHWLAALGMAGAYHATRVERGGLAAFLDERRRDPSWRGCSVTLPHKEAIAVCLDSVDDAATRVGAVNCVYRQGGELAGTNTDVDGIAYALDGIDPAGGKVAVLGAGGAARAMLAWLATQQVGETVLLVRDPKRAEPLTGGPVRAATLDSARGEFADARLIVNASPLGMAGSPAMPPHLLDALALAPAATVMDMVYKPLDTDLLAAARALGLKAVDGLDMLTGQARRAFTLFFGVEPPPADAALRTKLVGGAR